QVTALALLGVAGDFALQYGQVAAPLHRDGGSQTGQTADDVAEDVVICGAELGQGGAALEGKDDAVKQAARPEQDSAAAAGPPRDRHVIGPAAVLMHIVGEPAAGAQ